MDFEGVGNPKEKAAQDLLSVLRAREQDESRGKTRSDKLQLETAARQAFSFLTTPEARMNMVNEIKEKLWGDNPEVLDSDIYLLEGMAREDS